MNLISTIPLMERPQITCQFLDGLDGFIITRGDEYLGEYVAPYAERLAWLTGFTGSAGFALLLKNKKSCVFSDGRYVTQLEEQVPHSLWERAHSGTMPLKKYLSLLMSEGETLKIGYDPHLISHAQLDSWRVEHVTFIPVEKNPIDCAWSDQPPPPFSEIIEQPLKYAGEVSLSKRERAAASLKEHGEKAFILADCTSIMWLLNLRGNDIPMTPVAHGYAILYDDASLDYFIDAERLKHISFDEKRDKIRLKSPIRLEEILKEFAHLKIACDPVTTPFWFVQKMKEYDAVLSLRSDPCALPKAIKNNIEQEGSKKAHFLDGIALIRFLSWLESHAIGKYETEISEKLESFRALSADYRGASFETISASGSNGAYPHYRAEKGKDSQITENSVYLVDSGAQYQFGTTDITRTLWIGSKEPDDKLKEHYTRVLKGNIALSQMRFPENIAGYRLDAIARSSLWEAGLDYDHGTGHGIGSYLSVHEGPQSISSAVRPIGLNTGMILSNEPGYYEVGSYGIRIENLLLVKEASINGFQGRKFLEFEVLSYTPIDKRLIDLSLLDEKEKIWLNSYHQKIIEKFLPYIEEEYHSWLKEKCAPL